MASKLNSTAENPEQGTVAGAEEMQTKASAKKMADEIIARHKLEEAEAKKMYENIEKMYKNFKGTEEQIAKKVSKALENYEIKRLQALSTAARNEEIKRQKAVHENRNKEIEQERAEELASLNLVYKDKRKREAEERKLKDKWAKEDRQRAIDYTKLVEQQTDSLRKARTEQSTLFKEREDALNKKIEEKGDNSAGGKANAAGAKALLAFDKISKGMKSLMDTESKKGHYKAAKENQDEMLEALEKAKEAGASDKELEKMRKALVDATNEANAAAVDVMKSAAANMVADEYKNVYNQAVSILSDYKGVMDARLQGSDKNFNKLQESVASKLTLSPFVKTTAVMEKLKEATEKGILYNIEQRAYLATLQEKLVQTFDAFDASLLRIIRLQQADSTVARMGMEAVLTKFLNSTFEDSSYLSDVYDTVSSAIIDANSQLTKEMSAEFEYIVQKWMGSLYSLGMSSETINTIAQGLNYIATGDVTSLNNNSQMQTLFALASSNAGLEYSDLLLHGLNASNTNKLLQGMVGYLKTIADNSENQVVKAAYGEVLNLSMSDMTALSNLTATDIKNIAGNTLSYSRMESETSMQMLSLITRTSLASMLDNLYQNVLYGVAEDMAGNPLMFGMNKMLEFMDSTGVDINIPFVNAMGFGLELNASVKDLMKMGLGVGQAMSLAGNLLGALASGSAGGLNLDAWGARETTRRGSGLSLSAGTMLGETSGSMGEFATSGSSSDTADSAMSSATDDASESSKITNKNSAPPEHSIEDVWGLLNSVIGQEASSYIVTTSSSLQKAFDEPTSSIRVLDVKGQYTQDGMLQVVDSVLNKTVSTELDAIKLLMLGGTTVVQTVKLDSNTSVKLDPEQITKAISEALKDEENKDAIKGLMPDWSSGDGVKVTINGNVPVVNATGEKLQVSNLVW